MLLGSQRHSQTFLQAAKRLNSNICFVASSGAICYILSNLRIQEHLKLALLSNLIFKSHLCKDIENCKQEQVSFFIFDKIQTAFMLFMFMFIYVVFIFCVPQQHIYIYIKKSFFLCTLVLTFGTVL